MHFQKPTMYVFAGNNGSGKSTLRSLIIDKIGLDINIDPDSIARRLDPDRLESKLLFFHVSYSFFCLSYSYSMPSHSPATFLVQNPKKAVRQCELLFMRIGPCCQTPTQKPHSATGEAAEWGLLVCDYPRKLNV